MGRLTKKRAGIELNKDEVKNIKKGRKALRKELRANGIKSKTSFEIAASSRGLYFDAGKNASFLAWLLGGKGLAVAAATAAIVLALMQGVAYINEMRGFMTINLSSDLYAEGFVLSETSDFQNALTRLYADSVADVSDMSIYYLPQELADLEGTLADSDYFAYGFYIQNGGETTVGYDWEITILDETLGVSDAVWLMVYENGEMLFYAKANADGSATCIPAEGETNMGYFNPPMLEYAADPTQFEVVTQVSETGAFYRIYPIAFASDTVMAAGVVEEIAPSETAKYTVVLWLEGDDPDCAMEIVNGSLGAEMCFTMHTTDDDAGEEEHSEDGTTEGVSSWWSTWWDKLVTALSSE